MKILLLSMPDSFEHMPEPVVRMPNGALTSLAGNVDPHHAVAVADLILVQRRVRQTVGRLVRDLRPDVVGLSVMTFQRETAKKIIALIRRLHPSARIVVGGYDPSLASEAYTDEMEGRAMDETASHSRCAAAQSKIHARQLAAYSRPHLPRKHLQIPIRS
jgi:hypothetical protein